ncbi:PQQ-dependent sugar dehydrogenase [Colwellia sp. 6_MG-2023]|uniref:PQQ-dependent sugar dehydrogenase n=1 Tax=Colwellia sp. 6_MG-2023 TaxID=3062676 RepID=UPI0026E1E614|nr:PQQ-dependent sugar dehydrogenase [Colwellia sp. 6_MG-2023]MDO6489098.1 PQQ-dependent sugar dehydrogenase [Colwellia sp. 6_MG-2023]
MNNNTLTIKKLYMSFFMLITSAITCAETQNKEYNVSTIVENLKYPWSIAFLPNNDMLVTERIGALRIIRDGKLLEKAISGLPDIYVDGPAGLFDILLDPNFEKNQKLYISYSAGTKSNNFVSVMSATLQGLSLQHQKVIFTGSSRNTPHHHGARMTFLPDCTLLITAGDGFNFREQAQSLQSMLGKVLRINTDGSIPKDNPFVHQNNVRPEIYSYGHRNPQAILVSKTGEVWLHEHGPQGGDELNLLKSGHNYGWPAISYGIDYSGALISPFTEAKGMEQPVTYWIPSIAPAGMTEYQGDIFPQWQGNLFIAALAGKSVRRLSLDDNKVIAEETLLAERQQRIRDIRTSPDGYLYILTDSEQGQLLKLSPNL